MYIHLLPGPRTVAVVRFIWTMEPNDWLEGEIFSPFPGEFLLWNHVRRTWMLGDYRNIVNKLSYYLSITQPLHEWGERQPSRFHTVPGDKPRSLAIIGNGTMNGIIVRNQECVQWWREVKQKQWVMMNTNLIRIPVLQRLVLIIHTIMGLKPLKKSAPAKSCPAPNPAANK